MKRSHYSAVVLFLFCLLSAVAAAQKTPAPENLELSRVVRSSGQLIAVGQRAAVFGTESGRFEAWVYPLKIMRDFELTFRADGRDIPAELIARTIETRPESTTVVYTYDQFSVRETVTVPVKEPGVIVRLDISTYTPLEITASFTRDFQLMWPAGLGGTFASWDASLNAFVMGEERRGFYGIIGSPHSSLIEQDYVTDYGTSNRESFRLEPVAKGYATRYLVIAGSIQGRTDAEDTYKRLLANAKTLESESAAYYRNYLRSTTSLEIPDKEIQQAYNWARISVAQGIVQSPLLGTGLVAGYRISGDTARPGFAWFFGRDSEWTDLALTADGDYETTRHALEFIMKFQREGWENSARDFADGIARRLVPELSLWICIGRCDSVADRGCRGLHHAERRHFVCAAELGSLVASLPVRGVDLRRGRVCEESGCWARLGRGRTVTSGPK